MYQIGDLVVYGRNGICEVADISTMKMTGIPKDKLYYILTPVKDKTGKICTPVDNVKVIIRPVISKKEAMELLRRIPAIEELWIPNEKMRESMYKESIRKCDCEEFIKIIKTLYIRKQDRIAQGKKITATDERYLKMAEGSLYSELSIVLGIPEEEMESYIQNFIEEHNVE